MFLEPQHQADGEQATEADQEDVQRHRVSMRGRLREAGSTRIGVIGTSPILGAMVEQERVGDAGRRPVSPVPAVMSTAPREDPQTRRARCEAIRALPVEPYIGLTCTEAEALAAEQGRTVRPNLGTLDGAPTRVRVEYGDDDRIRSAHAG